jgi:hypothetical protein
MISDLLEAIRNSEEDAPTEDLSTTIRQTRSDPERWVKRARLSARMGEFRQARGDLQCALSIAPDHLAARLELMRVDAQLERLEREIYQQDPWVAVAVHGPEEARDPRRRGFFETHMGPTVPSITAVEAIASWVGTQTILEIGSGKGLWARLLREAGVEVLATQHPASCRSPSWMTVMPLDAEDALRTLAADVLLLDGDGVGHTADLLHSFRGTAMIVRGGIHAELRDALDAHWTCVHRLQIPSWTLDRDTVRFLVRRSR